MTLRGPFRYQPIRLHQARALRVRAVPTIDFQQHAEGDLANIWVHHPAKLALSESLIY